MNGKKMPAVWMLAALVALALMLVSCGAATEPTAEPTTAEPTQPAPTLAPPPTEPLPTEPPAAEELFPPEMPSAVRGSAVYTANCASCHGEEGDGSGLAGAADFTDVEFMRNE